MTIRDLVTRGRRERNLPARGEEGHPFFSLQRQVNDLFNSFLRGSELSPFGEMDEWYAEFSPKIDVHEDDKKIEIAAELPGMDENDIEVSLARDSITLVGEKKEEKEEKGKDCWHMERSYGRFRRIIPLPGEIDSEKAKATFKKGVLRVSLPKTVTAEPAGRKIQIKTE
jgi:HSP20 family protein